MSVAASGYAGEGRRRDKLGTVNVKIRKNMTGMIAYADLNMKMTAGTAVVFFLRMFYAVKGAGSHSRSGFSEIRRPVPRASRQAEGKDVLCREGYWKSFTFRLFGNSPPRAAGFTSGGGEGYFYAPKATDSRSHSNILSEI